MRVTRHPYEIGGWGVGELWVGDGRVVVAHDPPVPWVSLEGAIPRTTRRTQPPTRSPAHPRAHAPTHPPTHPRGTPGVPTETLSGHESQVGNGFVSDVLQHLHSYFAGERVSFDDVPLDEDWGTPFQAALARALRAVPWGEVVSYGELSARAGRARAARAAGTFCAENRFSLFVPCHRVVSADGIGGYGSLGVEYKRRLLALEHVAL